MSRIKYGSHLARQFSEELVCAAFSTTLDFRLMEAGEALATPESPTWLAVLLDQFTDSAGPDQFHAESLDRLVHDARRAAILAAPPVAGAAAYAIQSGLMGGGALFIMTEPSRIFLWLGRLRQAGDYQPAITIWHRPPR